MKRTDLHHSLGIEEVERLEPVIPIAVAIDGGAAERAEDKVTLPVQRLIVGRIEAIPEPVDALDRILGGGADVDIGADNGVAPLTRRTELSIRWMP